MRYAHEKGKIIRVRKSDLRVISLEVGMTITLSDHDGA